MTQRDHRHRGPPLLRELGRRRARHRPRPRAGRAQPQGGAGRLDHRPAVRQERPAGAVRPHRVPEDARGGAGLPPHAQVAQEQDPHRVPELDLLRQRRLRRRVGGAHLLRQPARPPGLRHARRTCASSSSSPRRPRCIAGVVANPTAYDPVAHPQAALARRNLVLKDMFDQGLLPLREYRDARIQALPAPIDIKPPDRAGPRRRTSRPGCASSSSTSSAHARAFEGGLKVHTTLDLELQKAAEQRGQQVPGQPGGAVGRRSSRSTTRPARCARWSAGATTPRARSTSPRRASASPARRSSRSSSPRR